MIKKLLFILLFTFGLQAFAQTVISMTGPATGPTGDWGIDVDLTTTDGVNYTIANHTFVAGEMKFRENHAWAVAYGYTTLPGFPTGVGSTSGGNISVTAGTYNVSFNLTTKAYSFTPGIPQYPVISIYGAGTNNTDVAMASTNGVDYIAKSVTFSAAGVKFRQDASSVNTWGATDWPSGTATSTGSDIPVPGGTYNVTFNYTTGAYTFTTTPVSMIGLGGPSGAWDTDAYFTTTDAINYTYNNAVIVGGGFKIRDNGGWAVQFGAVTNPGVAATSGVAVQNGYDLTSISGTYNITFNRTTLAYNFEDVLGVEDNLKGSFSVYPNPSSSVWHFASTANDLNRIDITDITGKTVLSQNAKGQQAEVDASTLPAGLYFARIVAQHATQTVKIVRK